MKASEPATAQDRHHAHLSGMHNDFSKAMKTTGKDTVSRSDALHTAQMRIRALDLSGTVRRMTGVYGWSKEQAEFISEQYKNFLFLKFKYPDRNIPPSQDIDDFWHNHILHTAKYIQDCQQVFGEYLQHDPHHENDLRATRRHYEHLFETVTQVLYYQEFGHYIEDKPTYSIVGLLQFIFRGILFFSKNKI